MKLVSRVALVLICSLAFSQKRNITETDIYAFQWIAGAQISPDGSQVVYTHVKVTSKHDGYETALWIIPATGGPAQPRQRQLTSGTFDADPRWSPDGKWITFVPTVAPRRQQIYLLSMEGGEARALTDIPRGAAGPMWSPDGKHIAFTSSTLPKDFEKKAPNAPDESDVRVITKAVYRNNGTGFAEPGRPVHI